MIARHLATACLIYLSLVLQSSFAANLAIYGARPWFPGIVLVMCAFRHDNTGSLLWSAVLGLAVDGVSAERAGVHVAIATLIATFLVIARQDIRSCGSLLAGAFALISTLLWRSGSTMTFSLLAAQTPDLTPMLLSIFGDSVYNALMTIGFLSLVQIARNRIRKPEKTPATILTNRWTMLTG